MTIEFNHEIDRLVNLMIAAETDSAQCARQYVNLEMSILELNDRLKAMEQRVNKNEDRLSAIDAASFKRSWA